MSLLQQPFSNTNSFIKDLLYFRNTNTSSLNENLIRGNLAYSNDFATYSNGIITINKSGYYNVYFNAYVRANYISFSGDIQIQLNVGSNIYSCQSGSSLPELNNFGVNDFVYSYGGDGQASFVSLSNIGFQIGAYLYFGTPNIYLNQNDTISMKIIVQSSNSPVLLFGINGFMKVDSVS